MKYDAIRISDWPPLPPCPGGATGYNMVLGQARADSVQKYLTNQGCDPGKVQSTSRGAMDATGTDEVGWAYTAGFDIKLGS